MCVCGCVCVDVCVCLCVRLRVCACVAAQVPCGCFAVSFCDCHRCVAEDLIECHIRTLRVVERRPVSYYVALCCVALYCVALCGIVICVISRATPSLLLRRVVLCCGVLCCIVLYGDLLCYFSSGLREYMHLYTVHGHCAIMHDGESVCRVRSTSATDPRTLTARV